MKLGLRSPIFRNERTLAAHNGDAVRRPSRFGELGSSGTVISGGLLFEQDYNRDFEGTKRYNVFDKMRKSDGTVAAALRAIKLPLLRAMWTVDPATESPQDKEVSDFVAADLFGMTIPWHQHLRHVLLMIDYGSYPFEKVWEIRDDKRIHLRKLAPRHPRTVTEWKVDGHGGFNGFKQQVLNDQAGVEDVPISPEKALVFVNELEGADFRGNSMLRPAYKHWWFKQHLETIDAIAKERRGTGIDTMILKELADDDDRSFAESVLMTLRSHERNFLTYPEDRMTYKIEGVGQGSVLSSLESVEHHDLRILRSMLSEFIAMGAGSTGSFAMHRDKTSLTMLALGGIGETITSTHNRFLIPQMVRFNFVGITKFPTLRHARLDVRDFKALAEAVGILVQNAVIQPDSELERELRELLELPQRSQSTPALRRMQTRAKREFVDSEVLNGILDNAREDILVEVRAIQTKQTEHLVNRGRTIHKRAAASELEDVRIPFKKQLADTVARVLFETFRRGKTEASQELKRQGIRTVSLQLGEQPEDEIRKFLRIRARAVANLLGDRVASTFVWEMLTQLRLTAFEEGTLTTRLTGLSEREARKIANSVASEAMNLGRERVFRLNNDKVRNLIYSSVLDEGTCIPCNQADGNEFQIGEVPDEVNPPNSQCFGGDRCRCIMVAVLVEEAA